MNFIENDVGLNILYVGTEYTYMYNLLYLTKLFFIDDSVDYLCLLPITTYVVRKGVPTIFL